MTHCPSAFNGIGWKESPEPVCGTCGSDNMSIDPKWCWECQEYVDLTTREKWLKEHPEDVQPYSEYNDYGLPPYEEPTTKATQEGA